MLQELLGNFYAPFRQIGWMPGVIVSSAAIVLAWGYFLFQGVQDPLGGINSLWPLFGIANQMLATIALCLCTTILVKMHRARFMWISCLPLAWLVSATFAASWQKIFSPLPRIGFLAQASQLQTTLDSGLVAASKIGETQALIFNARLDAVVCGLFLLMAALVLVDSIRLWIGILIGSRAVVTHDTPFVPSQLNAEEI
jgi:carbon starvation protein